MTALMLKFLALILGFALWAALAYLKMVPVEPLVALLQMGLGGLVTHMLQDGNSPAVAPFAPAAAAAPVAPSGQGGFASVRMLSVVAVIALGSSMLTGCGALNTATGAALNYTAQNGAGAIENIRAAHDQAFIAWTQAACNVQIGALARNATGNPGAVRAALEACPVPSMGLVDVKNGSVTVMTAPVLTAPTPAAPYSPAAK